MDLLPDFGWSNNVLKQYLAQGALKCPNTCSYYIFLENNSHVIFRKHWVTTRHSPLWMVSATFGINYPDTYLCAEWEIEKCRWYRFSIRCTRTVAWGHSGRRSRQLSKYLCVVVYYPLLALILSPWFCGISLWIRLWWPLWRLYQREHTKSARLNQPIHPVSWPFCGRMSYSGRAPIHFIGPNSLGNLL